MQSFNVKTHKRTQFINIDSMVREAISASGLESGAVHVFVPHTTAGVTINENADPDVTADMEMVFERMVPWSDGYAHMEGNTAAHVKTSMMGSSEFIPFEGGRLSMGTWQSVYFCEFDGPRSRKVWIQVLPAE